MSTTDPVALLEKGRQAFNTGDYYDAHEYWEELWSEHPLTDRLFVQGLIQMAVGYFQITNDNLAGARSLFTKALPKLQSGSSGHRNLNTGELIERTQEALDLAQRIEKSADFDWSLVPEIKHSPENEA